MNKISFTRRKINVEVSKRKKSTWNKFHKLKSARTISMDIFNTFHEQNQFHNVENQCKSSGREKPTCSKCPEQKSARNNFHEQKPARKKFYQQNQFHKEENQCTSSTKKKSTYNKYYEQKSACSKFHGQNQHATSSMKNQFHDEKNPCASFTY